MIWLLIGLTVLLGALAYCWMLDRAVEAEWVRRGIEREQDEERGRS